MATPKAIRVSVAQRRTKAVQLRLEGKSYQQIADALGYSSRSAACVDVTRALEAAVAEQRTSVEALREEELQRLDLLLVEAWAVLKRAHVTVSHGKVIVDEDGNKILDDGPVLQAIDRVLKIQERRAKFLGLDAPVRHEVVTMDAIDAEINRLNVELAAAELYRDEAGEASGAEAPSG